MGELAAGDAGAARRRRAQEVAGFDATSGESGGNLEEMLERAAVNQERELETILSAILGIFEPLLILVMGGIVLLIVIAVLLPIFEINQLVA